MDENFVEEFVEKEIVKKFPTLHVIKSYTPVRKTWDITSEKATKYLAVHRLAKLLEIRPQQIVGVGDGYNDYPLLTACGYKVAMSNAHKELKAIADYIAPSYKEDGIAVLINKLLKN
jgi:hydroxymethylpyrimidine pyrophosphatase-like HAD family hydrolase